MIADSRDGAEQPGVLPGRSQDGLDPRTAESPEAALRRIVSELELGDGWTFAGRDRKAGERAVVCRVRPGRVLHVAGRSEMAAQLRELLTSGAAPGWELHPLPPGQTPLHVLVEPLLAASRGHRFYNLLNRYGFATVEEVAATPDDCLLRLYQGGPKMVSAIRRVLGDLGWESPSAEQAALTDAVIERRRHVAARLADSQRCRYREFADMLARSLMPVAAVDKIIDSLNGEAVPPADPLVCLLLETAGEAELLDYYQRTHPQPPGGADSR